MNKQGFATNIILVAVIVALAGVVVYLVLPREETPTPPSGTVSPPPVTPPPATTITPSPPTSILDQVILRSGTARLYQDTNLVELPSGRIIRSLAGGTDIELAGEVTFDGQSYLQSRYSYDRRVPNFFSESATQPTGLAIYRGTLRTWFEGCDETSYAFNYSPQEFSVSGVRNVSIKELNSNRLHTLEFVYNDAAGFSPRQYWEIAGPQSCPDCQEVGIFAGFNNYPNFQALVFANSREEWIIGGPGFAVAKLQKPSDRARSVIATLTVTGRHFAANPEECR